MKTQRNMFKDDQERPNYADRNSEDVFSIPVRAGKRTYFFDVKTTKGNNDYYLTITETPSGIAVTVAFFPVISFANANA